MGLYPIDCPQCGKAFQWFSGNAGDQRCSECKQPTPSAGEASPREWRLPLTTLIINSSFTRGGDNVHVIEHSAYLAIKAQLEQVTRERDELKSRETDKFVAHQSLIKERDTLEKLK